MKRVYVAESKIGKGVFAARDFEPDEVIFKIEGEVVETTNPDSYSDEIQNHWFPFAREGNLHKYVLPEAPWMFLNHSCTPNAGIKKNRTIVAMRSIKKGEEILIDYAMNNIDDWTMNCNCGSPHCRKIVSTFANLDEKAKKKYSGYTIARLDNLKSQNNPLLLSLFHHMI